MRSRRRPLLAILATGALLLAGCSGADPLPEDQRTSSASFEEDLQYHEVEGTKLLLNACLPAITTEPTAAVILIHGGGFETGNKDSQSMMGPCRQLAEYGVAGFAVDYRLAPDFTYPAQVDDVSAAVEWLREPEQAAAFGIDPDRIGLFGSSAGAIMAASVGTAGEGPTNVGSRVAAVVALSPAADLTASGFSLGSPSEDEVSLILQYLGCDSVEDCPDAREASPLFAVDSSDPPFFIAISDSEIVPVQQAEALAAALEAADVPVTLEIKPGDRHAIRLLDESTRVDILAFLQDNLSG